jgi:hypothetical protein
MQVVMVTAKDTDIPVLDNIHIQSDGTTIGSSRSVVLCVSPVNEKIRKGLHLKDSILEKGVTINSASIKKVMSNMPHTKLFGGLLEHCDVRNYGGETIYFDLHDGSRDYSIKAKKYPMEYTAYKNVLKSAFKNTEKMQIVVNRKRLKLLLDALEKVCPDSEGESPVFLEFSKNNTIIVRAINMLNGQRAMGAMYTYKIDKKKWLSFSDWERSLLNENTGISRGNKNNCLSVHNDFDNNREPNHLQFTKKKGAIKRKKEKILDKKRRYI